MSRKKFIGCLWQFCNLWFFNPPSFFGSASIKLRADWNLLVFSIFVNIFTPYFICHRRLKVAIYLLSASNEALCSFFCAASQATQCNKYLPSLKSKSFLWAFFWIRNLGLNYIFRSNCCVNPFFWALSKGSFFSFFKNNLWFLWKK